ncbi:tyrosine-type recombinase/integrase [Candidatus Magnetobacterium casense]|uniref:Tyrosine-type recombinase/integrase n=1 Tax=Candidatus Magnetobacterium casense TaxID=1455061 RepID=A0ABS6S311_9BACT|nr:tyrosine-type recombinase/integrase [Candidatus Magnetobacterium casensis]MBV6343231.1 tyrosine-type recombinase/integrase [Candidatus Magnetobacterium casensis]
MALEHLNTPKSHDWLNTLSGHLNLHDIISTDTTLHGQLKIFLLSCRVNELSPRTIEDYSQKVGAFVAFCQSQGIKEPQDVAANHVRIFLLVLRERIQASSVHDYYGCINRFFNWLVAEGILLQSPMVRMTPPRVPKQVIQPFSQEDIRRMLVVLGEDGFRGIRNRAIILTFLDTGLRLSELAAVQVNDIDFDNGIIKVMGKGRKERFVRVGKETQKAMLRYLLLRKDKQPSLWVDDHGQPIKARGIQSLIKRLGKRAGITDARCSPHTFRHSFAVNCLRNGMGEFNLQSLLGHTTLQMTRRYVQTFGVSDALAAHEKASPVDNLRL